MEEQSKGWAFHLRQSLWIFAFGVVVNGLFCPSCLQHLAYTWDDFLYTGLLWVVLWKGNEYLADFPNRYLSWKERPITRLLVGIVVHITYTLIASITLFQLIQLIEDGHFQPLNTQRLIDFNFSIIVITIIISLFMTARGFLFAWRDLAVEHEQLKAESMASRLASLKAQVNPHFLFNSLNVLSGLVYRDADLSAQFIKKLSEVYRYVLDRQEEELVPIAEELEFVESVVFLQRIRFGEHLHVHQEIPASAGFLVAPMALQMLIENAIKHNAISEQQPLHIYLERKDDYLVVRNNLQPKTTLSESLGIGLDNIRKRYGFLSDRPVVVQEKENQFIVKLPIIQPA